VILSLWVDGNIKAKRRLALDQKRPPKTYQNRFVIPAKTIEEEFKVNGFTVIDKIDFLPHYAMWPTYVLHEV
jgi:hypothetical protein